MFAQSPLRLLSKKVSNLGPIVLCITAAVLCHAGTVNIYPGDDIPTIVNNNPAGTTFIIYPGLYRLATPITAQDGDSFIGQTACAPPTTSCPAILSGSELLTSFQYDGTNYYVTGQTQQGKVNIPTQNCQPGPVLIAYPNPHPGCGYPEDLFFDGVPLLHQIELTAVAPGSWYFDYTNHIIYFRDNPAGHTVETSVLPSAFWGLANNVTIQYLTVEEFATPIFNGTISGAGGTTSTEANWTVKNNEVTLNHGIGVGIGFGWQVLNNYVYMNGDVGIGGGLNNTQQSNVLIEGNELAFNNYAGVRTGVAAGGLDIAGTLNMVVRNNYSHDNVGDGFHSDHAAYGVLYDNNVSTHNTEEGILHEISYNGTFRNNQLLQNGYVYPQGSHWLYSSGMLSSTSQGDQAYCNTVEVPVQGGNGIDILAQPREGFGGSTVSQNNYFHDNTVVFDGPMPPGGQTGGGRGSHTDICCVNFFTTNNFDYNTYHAPDLTVHLFAWNDIYNSWTTFQADGQEAHGSADNNNIIANVPTVAIISPADMSTVSGTVNVQSTAKAAKGLSQLEYYVDWKLEQTVTKSPFTFVWNTSGVTTGKHTVAVKAYDTTGLSACYAEWLTVN
jgi:Bacterial Ig domain/Right handed beta helix region